MVVTIILIIAFVQLAQFAGNFAVRRLDKRIQSMMIKSFFVVDYDPLGGSGANFWFELDQTYAFGIDHAASPAFQIAGAVWACFGNLPRLNWFLRMRWSSSMPAMVTLARRNLLKPSIEPILAFTPRWSCLMMSLPQLGQAPRCWRQND